MHNRYIGGNEKARHTTSAYNWHTNRKLSLSVPDSPIETVQLPSQQFSSALSCTGVLIMQNDTPIGEANPFPIKQQYIA